MGPLELSDFIGNDVMLNVMDVLHRGFGDPKFRAAPLLRQMVTAGHLGRKTGRGFYRYDESGKKIADDARGRAGPRPARTQRGGARRPRHRPRLGAARGRAGRCAARRGGALRRLLFHRAGELGITGLPYPERYGGAGLGTFAWALAAEEVAAAEMALGVSLSVHILTQLCIFSTGRTSRRSDACRR